MAGTADSLTAGSAVSALCWVPRGKAAQQPQSYVLGSQERQKVAGLHRLQPSKQRKAEQTESQPSRQQGQPQQKEAAGLGKGKRKRLQAGSTAATAAIGIGKDVSSNGEESDSSLDGSQRLRAFGEDDAESLHAEEEEEDGENFFGVLKEDGYATLNDPLLKLSDGEDSEEEDANRILPTDLILVAANAEYDLSSLEIYVYDEDMGSFYVHHDIWCGGYPLCLEWVSDCSEKAAAAERQSSSNRNLVASGSFDPQISIWDLDVLDRVEAVCTLGAAVPSTGVTGTPAVSRSKKQKRNRKACSSNRAASESGSVSDQQGHEGPVMTLHKSPTKHNVLASGSADDTVKLWDLVTSACVHTYRQHTDKVQCIRWHPFEEGVLLSASYDRRAALVDVRNPKNLLYSSSLSADAECCSWDRHQPFTFWTSTEDGYIACYDVRRMQNSNSGSFTPNASSKAPAALWKVKAHKQAASGVCDSAIPSLMISCGIDGYAKLWKVSASEQSSSSVISTDSNNGISSADQIFFGSQKPQLHVAGAAPTLVYERALKGGPLYCCSSNEDVPQVVGFGGNCVVLWDLTDSDVVKTAFNLKDSG